MAQYNKFVDVTFTSTGVPKQLNFPFLPSQIEMWNKTKWGTASNNLVKYAISWAEDAPGTAYALENTASASSSGAQLSNKSNQSVAVVTTPGTGAVTFDTNTVLGTGFTHTVGQAGLTVVNAGTYKFIFDVSGAEPNQFQIYVNNVAVPGTTFGSGAGTQQNTGFGLLTLAAGDVVTLVNSVSASAITLAASTPIGGTNVDNSNASLSLTPAAGSFNDTVVLANGGFTFFSAGTYQYGPIFTITGISAPGVVTTSAPNGYAVGDTVLLYGTTGMLQIAGTPTTITAINSPTTFTIGNIPTAGFAAVATAGFAKKVLYADLYVPFSDIITGITLGVTTVITLSVNHRFVVGQEVQIVIPSTPYVNTTSVWGTQQLDSNYVLNTTGVPQQAYVTAVTPNSITVNINSTGFAPFTYPTSAQAAMGLNFPQVLAIGDQNSGGTLVPPLPIVPPAITIPGAWFANTRQGVIVGIGDGTNLMHQTGDIVRVRASYPDGLYLNV